MKQYKQHKKSKILKEALKHLSPTPDWPTLMKNGKEKYICCCINKVLHNDPGDFTDSSGLIGIIESRLDGEAALDWWLINQGITWEEQRRNSSKLQETRKQWMLSMIEEFKAQGD